MELVTMAEAARRSGVTVETIKRRVRRGELNGHQHPRPQGFTWLIEMPEETDDPDSTPSMTPLDTPSTNGEVRRLEDIVCLLQKELDSVRTEAQQQLQTATQQLEAKDKQIGELHVLLQQAALPAPKENHRAWWRFWGR